MWMYFEAGNLYHFRSLLFKEEKAIEGTRTGLCCGGGGFVLFFFYFFLFSHTPGQLYF